MASPGPLAGRGEGGSAWGRGPHCSAPPPCSWECGVLPRALPSLSSAGACLRPAPTPGSCLTRLLQCLLLASWPKPQPPRSMLSLTPGWTPYSAHLPDSPVLISKGGCLLLLGQDFSPKSPCHPSCCLPWLHPLPILQPSPSASFPQRLPPFLLSETVYSSRLHFSKPSILALTLETL